MSKPLLLIRTDGNNKIGMGHVYRSIALCQEMKKRGFEISFLVPRNHLVLSKLKNFATCYITNNKQTREISIIKKIKPDVVVIDLLKKFFPYGDSYFKSIRNFCKLSVTIDYVGSESKWVDLGINYLFKPKPSKNIIYDSKYSIIRREFVKVSKKYRIKKNADSILVIQGGADTYCVSPKIIEALNQIDKKLEITLILGPAFKCWKEIQSVQTTNKKFTVLHNVTNMSEIMAKHQIAISAGGNTLFELLTVGVPTLIVCGEKHELEIANLINKQNYAINLGYGPTISKNIIAKNVENLLNNLDLRRTFNKNKIGRAHV